MNNTLTYYDILQVSPGASQEVIKAAYRALQKQMHPDVGGDTELAQAINEAGEVLSDPVERNRYDTRMRIGKAKTFSTRTQVVEKIVERTFVFCLACGSKNRVEPDRMGAGRCGECMTPFMQRTTTPPQQERRPQQKEDVDTDSNGFLRSHLPLGGSTTSPWFWSMAGLAATLFLLFVVMR